MYSLLLKDSAPAWLLKLGPQILVCTKLEPLHHTGCINCGNLNPLGQPKSRFVQNTKLQQLFECRGGGEGPDVKCQCQTAAHVVDGLNLSYLAPDFRPRFAVQRWFQLQRFLGVCLFFLQHNNNTNGRK